jgi:AcrR family transcriptional regulator
MSEPARRPAGRPRADNPIAAETFRNAALNLFAEKNYSAVSVKDIAEATGMTASLIYYYFGCKDGLFLQVLEATIEKVFAIYAKISDPEVAPDAVLSNWLQLNVDNFPLIQKLIKISMDYSNTHSRTPEIDAAIAHFYASEAKVLSSAIKRGVASGLFRPVDPTTITTLISTFLDGAVVRPIICPDFNPLEAIGQFKGFLLQTLLAAR